MHCFTTHSLALSFALAAFVACSSSRLPQPAVAPPPATKATQTETRVDEQESPAAQESGAGEAVPGSSLAEVIEEFPYGVVSHVGYEGKGEFLMNAPDPLLSIEHCLSPEQSQTPYSERLPLAALAGGDCQWSVERLLQLEGQEILLVDDQARTARTKIRRLFLDARISSFSSYGSQGEGMTISEAYSGGPVLAVSFDLPKDLDEPVLAQLDAKTPFKELSFERDEDVARSFIEEASKGYEAELRRNDFDPDSVRGGVFYSSSKGMLFFGEHVHGDPSCGDEESDYGEASIAFSGTDSTARKLDLSSAGCDSADGVPTLAWMHGDRVLLLFHERYSRRPFISEFDGLLCRFLSICSVHPDNHPC